MNRILPTLLAALALLAASQTLGAQEPAPRDPETRLLEAELIEMAEGEPAAALPLYQGLLAVEGLAPELRARTLFALARAHRKLGELGAARLRYEELIEGEPTDARIVQAAHRYLAEIETAVADLPSFDWIAQVQESPEMQARIFEWGMALASEDTEGAAETAKGKLIALGEVVRPVVETMRAESRNPLHRRQLAEVLLQVGGLSQLEMLLRESGEQTDSALLVTVFGDAPESVRAEGRALLPALLPLVESPGLKAVLRRLFGDMSQLTADARDLSMSRYSLIIRDWVTDPTFPPRMVEAIEPLRTTAPRSYFRWLEFITREGLEASEGLGLYRPLIEETGPVEEISDLASLLLRMGKVDEVCRILAGANAPHLQFRFRLAEARTPGPGARTGNLRVPSHAFDLYPSPVSIETRVAIARAAGHWEDALHHALTDDRFVEDFVATLSAWSPDAEQGDRSADPMLEASRWRSARADSWKIPVEWLPEASPYRATPRLQAVLREAWGSLTEPRAKSIVLHILARFAPEATPETRQLFREILTATPEAELGLLIPAAVGALRCGAEEDREESSGLILRIEAGRIEAQAKALSSSVEERGRAHFRQQDHPIGLTTIPSGLTTRLVPALQRFWIDLVSEEAMVGELERCLLSGAVGPSALELAGRIAAPNGSLRRRGGVETPSLLFTVETALERGAEPAAVLAYLKSHPLATRAVSRIFALAWVGREEIPVETRARLFAIIEDGADSLEELPAPFEAAAWWGGGDPLVTELFQTSGVEERAKSRLLPHASTLRGAEQTVVRRWAWQRQGGDVGREELRLALADADSEVADLAWEIVKAEETEETLPLLHAVAQSPRSSHRTSAIERIAAFASPRSIPVLTALLDDDLLSIRSGALAALEEIERVAAERRKWQERKAEGRR